MSISFLHLSDIHFGQEKGGDIYVHNDVKERLLLDAQRVVAESNLTVDGIIVTGDVAYSGKSEQFRAAGAWLDRLASAIGCSRTAVQVVPGNHDIDRTEISNGCRLMLSDIRKNGEEAFDIYLENELDRISIYRKLDNYFNFAEGYNCFLDKDGGVASNKSFTIYKNKKLRIMGLNSALMCGSGEKEGDLLLGARQRVLPINDDEELVVLCHHPLNWFNDGETARAYIRNRARVLMTGHEHRPSVRIDRVKDDWDVLVIASGATVPPRASDDYGYTYNILTFDWDSKSNSLKVEVIPRAWSDEDMDFVEDKALLQDIKTPILLKAKTTGPIRGNGALNLAMKAERENRTVQEGALEIVEETTVPERYALVLLRFFRDLSPLQRMRIFVRLEALPPNWNGKMTHGMERHVVDNLIHRGLVGKLEEEIEREELDT